MDHGKVTALFERQIKGHNMKLFSPVLGICACLAGGNVSAGDIEFRDAFLSGSLEWSEVEAKAAEEGAVNIHYWGGDDLLNVWMGQVVAAEMSRRGVTVNAVPITATKDAIDLVLAEKAAGRGIGEGSVDLIWVNGENFAALKRQDALFGGFARLLPNARNLEWDDSDPRSVLNLRDFGVSTGAAEVPWSSEQYVCAVNTAFVDSEQVPATFEQMQDYLRENPGKFTYVKPPHYLGNTFVQEAIYAHNPDGTGAIPFQSSIDDISADEFARLIAPGIAYLQEIEPYLLDGSDGSAHYPEDNKELDGLFLNGEVHFNCKFGLYAAATGLATGSYPAETEQFVFPEGAMIKNKSYLVIPANAPHPAAALLLADWMTSVDSQVSKLAAVGMPLGIDSWKLSEVDAERLAAASPGLIGVTQSSLDANGAPDTNATLVNIIEAVWLEVIERDSERPLSEIVEALYETLGE